MPTKTVTPKEIALDWGVSPKTLRKFLRTDKADMAPGKGGRWAIPSTSLKSMRKRFDAWQVEEAAKRKEALETRQAENAAESDDEVELTESPEGDDEVESDETVNED